MIGQKIVGYRYGAAPESGYSFNSRENCAECGVSMAQVGYLPEDNHMAVVNLKSKKVRKYYYIGIVAGFGGDDEICLTDTAQITRIEYLKLKKETTLANNVICKELQDRDNRIKNLGYNIQDKNWMQYTK